MDVPLAWPHIPRGLSCLLPSLRIVCSGSVRGAAGVGASLLLRPRDVRVRVSQAAMQRPWGEENPQVLLEEKPLAGSGGGSTHHGQDPWPRRVLRAFPTVLPPTNASPRGLLSSCPGAGGGGVGRSRETAPGVPERAS